MSGMFVRRGALVLAILVSLVIALLTSVSSVAASPQKGSSNGARFAYSGTLECPSPPANWDPTTATADQLHFYGLPLPHASSGSDYLTWLNRMRHITRRICGGEVVGKSYSHLNKNHTSDKTVGSNGEYWSGYVVPNSGFNYVSGDWDVPCYSGTNNSQRAIEWVGIGGVSGNNLWQAGTESDHAEGYRFWYEDYPTQSMIYAGPAVGCNQAVNVEVDYSYNVGGKAYVWMYNYYNGQYYSATKSFVPDRSTAEWIVERPGCSLTTSKNWALAPIGTVYWSSTYAASTSYDNDIVHDLGYFSSYYYPEDMYQDNVLLSNNSGVSGGEYFSTYYDHSGVSYCP